jgi:hypothetical protein
VGIGEGEQRDTYGCTTHTATAKAAVAGLPSGKSDELGSWVGATRVPLDEPRELGILADQDGRLPAADLHPGGTGPADGILRAD